MLCNIWCGLFFFVGPPAVLIEVVCLLTIFSFDVILIFVVSCGVLFHLDCYAYVYSTAITILGGSCRSLSVINILCMETSGVMIGNTVGEASAPSWRHCLHNKQDSRNWRLIPHLTWRSDFDDELTP